MKPTNNNHCCNCSKKSPLFCCLTEQELALVNENRTQVSYQAGEIIAKQGSPMAHVISFTSGIAKVYIEGANKKNLILQFLKPTQFLGGPGIFFDRKHHFTVSAVTDSTVCFIKIEVFIELVRSNTLFSEAFLKYVSENGIFNYDRFITLTQKNMQGRIAEALIYLKNQVFVQEKSIVINSRDLAEYTGMSKDSVIRIIKEFEMENIISMEKNTIEIFQPEKLESILKNG